MHDPRRNAVSSQPVKITGMKKNKLCRACFCQSDCIALDCALTMTTETRYRCDVGPGICKVRISFHSRALPKKIAAQNSLLLLCRSVLPSLLKVFRGQGPGAHEIWPICQVAIRRAIVRLIWKASAGRCNVALEFEEPQTCDANCIMLSVHPYK